MIEVAGADGQDDGIAHGDFQLPGFGLGFLAEIDVPAIEDGRALAAALLEPPGDAVAAGRMSVSHAGADVHRAGQRAGPDNGRELRRRRMDHHLVWPYRAGDVLDLVGGVGDNDRQIGVVVTPAGDLGLVRGRR